MPPPHMRSSFTGGSDDGRACVAQTHATAADAGDDVVFELLDTGRVVGGDAMAGDKHKRAKPVGTAGKPQRRAVAGDAALGTATAAIAVDKGRSLLVADDDATIRRVDVATGAVVASHRLADARTRGPLIDCSGDASVLYTMDGDRLVALDATTLGVQRTFEGRTANEGPATCVSVSPSGSFVVTGHSQQRAVLWSMEDGDRHSVLANVNDDAPGASVTAACISPDGSLVALGDDSGAVGLYELGVGTTPLLTVNPAVDSGADSPVACIRYSPTRYWMACAVGAHVVVYNLETKGVLICTSWHDGGEKRSKTDVTSLAFTAGGTTFVAVHADGATVRVQYE